jgi:hypothetical protein
MRFRWYNKMFPTERATRFWLHNINTSSASNSKETTDNRKWVNSNIPRANSLSNSKASVFSAKSYSSSRWLWTFAYFSSTQHYPVRVRVLFHPICSPLPGVCRAEEAFFTSESEVSPSIPGTEQTSFPPSFHLLRIVAPGFRCRLFTADFWQLCLPLPEEFKWGLV